MFRSLFVHIQEHSNTVLAAGFRLTVDAAPKLEVTPLLNQSTRLRGTDYGGTSMYWYVPPSPSAPIT